MAQSSFSSFALDSDTVKGEFSGIQKFESSNSKGKKYVFQLGEKPTKSQRRGRRR